MLVAVDRGAALAVIVNLALWILASMRASFHLLLNQHRRLLTLHLHLSAALPRQAL